jgi:DNA-binding Xre family transcriptional regulator
MVKTRIGELARAAGITKAYHLQTKLGVAASMAARLFNDEAQGLDFSTIDRLCEFFGCEPGDLFVREVMVRPKRTVKATAAPVARRRRMKSRDAV